MYSDIEFMSGTSKLNPQDELVLAEFGMGLVRMSWPNKSLAGPEFEPTAGGLKICIPGGEIGKDGEYRPRLWLISST